MEIKFADPVTEEVTYSRQLLPSQEAFWEAAERFVLFSGGYGCGKSMILILKAIYSAVFKPDNYILMGRRTYGEIHDVLYKDFLDICPEYWIVSKRSTPHPTVVLKTIRPDVTSEIIFRNLDKFSDTEVAGLNLGDVFIDQAEDTPENIFVALKGRLRRFNKEYHQKYGYEWDEEKSEGEMKSQVCMTANPALSWLYRAFVQDNNPEYRLIEASTLENKENLPKEYLEELKSYPDLIYKQFVLGKWDESLFAENAVFAAEHLQQLSQNLMAPVKEKEGLEIYKPYKKGHKYQMGIDCAEGADTIDERYKDSKKDNAVIVIVDMDEEEEVAKWAGRLPPNATADKAVLFASWYGEPLMVPEMNSMGSALINRLQDLGYNNVYRRHEFDKTLNKRLPKLGFRTTAASKAVLVERFNKRLRLCDPTIYSRDTYAEMKHFVYSDLAGKKGMGAQEGFHDDKVMATMLAFYEDKDPIPTGKRKEKRATIEVEGIVPSVTLLPNGKYKPPKFFQKEKQANWHTI